MYCMCGVYTCCSWCTTRPSSDMTPSSCSSSSCLSPCTPSSVSPISSLTTPPPLLVVPHSPPLPPPLHPYLDLLHLHLQIHQIPQTLPLRLLQPLSPAALSPPSLTQTAAESLVCIPWSSLAPPLVSGEGRLGERCGGREVAVSELTPAPSVNRRPTDTEKGY